MILLTRIWHVHGNVLTDEYPTEAVRLYTQHPKYPVIADLKLLDYNSQFSFLIIFFNYKPSSYRFSSISSLPIKMLRTFYVIVFYDNSFYLNSFIIMSHINRNFEFVLLNGIFLWAIIKLLTYDLCFNSAW